MSIMTLGVLASPGVLLHPLKAVSCLVRWIQAGTRIVRPLQLSCLAMRMTSGGSLRLVMRLISQVILLHCTSRSKEAVALQQSVPAQFLAQYLFQLICQQLRLLSQGLRR